MIGLETAVLMLPIESIRPNPAQPRRQFSPASLAQLALSIRECGQLQPIVVRALPQGEYELVAGERRLLALKSLGETHIAAVVRALSDEESALAALIENLQREALSFWEEAEALEALLRTYPLTQTRLAARLGLAPSTVANKLRLLRLPAEVRALAASLALGERHARALLCLEGRPMLQLSAVRHIGEKQLTAAQAEGYVGSLLAGAPAPRRKLVLRDLRIFQTTLERAVETMRSAGVPVASRRREDEENITYTLTIPKSAAPPPRKAAQ